MDILAILAIRNEEAYLSNCLRYLCENGIQIAVIDNGSTDGSRDILQSFRLNLVRYESIPYVGRFDWKTLLTAKARIAEESGADWVIHHDCDEMMHSFRDGESLGSAIKRLDSAGYNVIDFDEFVFLPIEEDYVPNRNSFPNITPYFFSALELQTDARLETKAGSIECQIWWTSGLWTWLAYCRGETRVAPLYFS